MRHDGTTSIATIGAPLVAQVHHETVGGPLAVRRFRSLVDIRGQRIPFVNDSLPVTMFLAMQKGSSFRLIQTDAEYVARAWSRGIAAFLPRPRNVHDTLLMASPGSYDQSAIDDSQ
jgi:hypothetical protein